MVPIIVGLPCFNLSTTDPPVWLTRRYRLNYPLLPPDACAANTTFGVVRLDPDLSNVAIGAEVAAKPRPDPRGLVRHH